MKTERIARVVARMQEEGLSQILVTAPNSVYYLTGMYVEPGERMLALLVRDDGTVTLFANRLFALTDASTVPLVEFDDTEDSVAVLAACLKPGAVGIDKFWPSQFTIRLMAARRDIVPVLGSRPVDLCRMQKDDEEVQLMIEASKFNDKIIENTITHIAPGMTEAEVVARINSQMPLEEKRKYADVVLDNSGSLEQTLAQVQGELKKLLGDASGC